MCSAVDAFYSEITDYDFNAGTFSMATGHFTQVVWKGTTQVGVAVSSNGQYLICNYLKHGNMMGAFAQNVSPRSGALPRPKPSPAPGAAAAAHVHMANKQHVRCSAPRLHFGCGSELGTISTIVPTCADNIGGVPPICAVAEPLASVPGLPGGVVESAIAHQVRSLRRKWPTCRGPQSVYPRSH